MEKIKKMIADGQTQKALSLLNAHLANHPEDDQAWFLKGNAYRKLGETRLALNSYLEAIAINPDSPAQSAYNMMIRILDFYNKDMYNQ